MFDLTNIHFHDCQILRVVEDIESHTLTMEVDYPVNWEANEFARRKLVFEDCYNYQVFELPFEGLPMILSGEVTGEEGGWSKVRLQTNMGRRELLCRGASVL